MPVFLALIRPCCYFRQLGHWWKTQVNRLVMQHTSTALKESLKSRRSVVKYSLFVFTKTAFSALMQWLDDRQQFIWFSFRGNPAQSNPIQLFIYNEELKTQYSSFRVCVESTLDITLNKNTFWGTLYLFHCHCSENSTVGSVSVLVTLNSLRWQYKCTEGNCWMNWNIILRTVRRYQRKNLFIINTSVILLLLLILSMENQKSRWGNELFILCEKITSITVVDISGPIKPQIIYGERTWLVNEIS